MPSGGPRSGKPGATYSNRSDLSGDASSTYGSGVTQRAVQTATPDTRTSQPVPPPGSFGTLTGPSNRPDEPVTAGLPIGAGAGPDALTPTPAHDQALWELRALANQYPDDRDLLRMIAMAESRL